MRSSVLCRVGVPAGGPTWHRFVPPSSFHALPRQLCTPPPDRYLQHVSTGQWCNCPGHDPADTHTPYLLLSAICRVLATSRRPYYEEAAAIGATFYEDVDDFCEEHPDVVILASSILSTEGVLASLPVQRLKRSTLFVDVLSVKVRPVGRVGQMAAEELGAVYVGPADGR